MDASTHQSDRRVQRATQTAVRASIFAISAREIKSPWSRAMASYKTIEEKDQRFAQNDLRAKVASEAFDLGLDATSMLGHSSDAVTRRNYIRGTRKVQPLR